MNNVKRMSLVSLLVLLASCSALGNKEPEPNWVEVEVTAPSDRVLWKLSQLSMERMNFPLAGGTDPGEGRLQSGWQTNLAPWSRKGYRIRAEMELSPLGPGRWQVKARVAKQINEALVAPLDPARAEWKWVADDHVQAQVLVQHVSAALSPEFELSEEEEDPLEALLRAAEESRP